MCDARVTLVTSDVLDSIRAAYLAGKLVDALELCAARCESDARESPEFLILHGCLLVLSNTVDQVTERCNEIKIELEENPRIIEDFGIQLASRQSSRTWTKSEFILPNRARVIGRHRV